MNLSAQLEGMCVGVIKSFCPENGYGFIVGNEEHPDVFVRDDVLLRPILRDGRVTVFFAPFRLDPGTHVIYNTRWDGRARPVATSVIPLEPFREMEEIANRRYRVVQETTSGKRPERRVIFEGSYQKLVRKFPRRPEPDPLGTKTTFQGIVTHDIEYYVEGEGWKMAKDLKR